MAWPSTSQAVKCPTSALTSSRRERRRQSRRARRRPATGRRSRGPRVASARSSRCRRANGSGQSAVAAHRTNAHIPPSGLVGSLTSSSHAVIAELANLVVGLIGVNRSGRSGAPLRPMSYPEGRGLCRVSRGRTCAPPPSFERQSRHLSADEAQPHRNAEQARGGQPDQDSRGRQKPEVPVWNRAGRPPRWPCCLSFSQRHLIGGYVVSRWH